MKVHPTAHVDPAAEIGPDAEIGPFTIVHANVRIGAGALIGSHCEIGLPTALAKGRPLTIGAKAVMRSHSIFYEGSTFGDGLTTGHRVTLREGIDCGRNAQFGTLTDVQGDCVIGDYFRSHSNVHVGKGSRIGDFVWIFPYCVLTNDPTPPSNVLSGATLKDYAVIATMSVILPGVTVGEHAVVGAMSTVSRDVPDRMLVSGNPAKPVRSVEEIKLRDGSGRAAYPWPRHFRRGYPPEALAAWDAAEDPPGDA
jgi:acyl-[acyl carrier protein]--UDP-N-acetylglucosamine O-acyltransferase